MPYLDTSVLISYGLESDSKHDDAVDLINMAKKLGKFHASPLTILEFYCVMPRIFEGGLQLPKGLQDIIEKEYDFEEKCKLARELMLTYLKNVLDLTVHSDSETLHFGMLQKIPFFDNSLEIFSLFALSFQFSHIIRVKALDIIHLTYALEYAKTGMIKHFVTLDQSLKKFEHQIKDHFNVIIVSSA